MLKVSLYIPCYNAGEHIDKCLDAVLKQTYPIDEVLVINDGSDDKSLETISEYPARVIDNGSNKGLAATRNIALNAARNNFVASVDADCIIDPDWLNGCMKNFEDPKVAAVGGLLAETHDRTIADSWRKRHLRHEWGENRVVDPIYLSGSNIVIRKDMVEQVGFYDEERFRNNYEDVELSRRLKAKGFKLIYEPKAVARHIRRDTIVSVHNTFWRWKFHDYKKKYMVRPIFNLINSLKLIFEDALDKNPRFIFMDALAFVFCTYFDLKKFLGKGL